MVSIPFPNDKKRKKDFNNDNIGDACDGLYIDEISSGRELIRVIDILGRSTNKKGLHFEIFNDGSVEKKYTKH